MKIHSASLSLFFCMGAAHARISSNAALLGVATNSSTWEDVTSIDGDTLLDLNKGSKKKEEVRRDDIKRAHSEPEQFIRGSQRNEQELQGCLDSPSGWYDSDDQKYNCAWYASKSCPDYGSVYKNWGKVAKEACCACNGGLREIWKVVAGGLKQVSISEDGSHVWGVNSADSIWYRNGVNGSWTQIHGGLTDVSVSADGSHVWGVTSGDAIFYRNGVNGKWVRILGSLAQISVSADGSHVWGVTSSGAIFHRNGVSGSWVRIPGGLKHVSVSANGLHVWGVNSGDMIYYRNGVSGDWVHIPGSLKQISVSADGSHVWGVNKGDMIYYRNGLKGSWEGVSGNLKQVSVSGDGEFVWGVNSSDQIYYRHLFVPTPSALKDGLELLAL